jgi:outer membrane biosynthesis protein TonB
MSALVQYPYHVRTLTSNINVTLLNYLYSKSNIFVTIDTTTYNIFIQTQNEIDHADVVNNVKKYYTQYTVYIPPPPITPVFTTEPISTNQPTNEPTTTTNTSNQPTNEPTNEPTTTTDTTNQPTNEPTTTTDTTNQPVDPRTDSSDNTSNV